MPSNPDQDGRAAGAAQHPHGDDLLETVFEQAPLGMVLFDAGLIIFRANAALADILGSTPEGLVGRSIIDLVDPADRDQGREALGRLERRELTWVTVRQRCSTDKGETRWVEFATRIFWSAGGAFLHALGIVRDITEAVTAEAALRESEMRTWRIAGLEQAQAQLQLADRMASMGTLAAGVAHEINNPLGFVVANLGFAQDEVSKLKDNCAEGPVLDRRLTALTWALAEAQEGASRVRNIVLDLRTFSHPDAKVRAPVDIRRSIDSAVNMAQGEIRGRARIVRHFDPVPPVLGNEARLAQLFLNLVVNAAHAFPLPTPHESTGDSTEDSTGDAGDDQERETADRPGGPWQADHGAISENQIRLSVTLASEGMIQAEVTDTGVGIPPEHLPRIFDPFFTTKPLGRGTGLGLPICHGIVQSLGGDISVTSTVGEGTTFRVLLPSTTELQPTPSPPAAVTRGPPRSRRARVLVIDDEPLMGSAIARVLGEYDVVALTSARLALNRIIAAEPFDVILCDVMMPEFSGIDLYEGIGREAPHLLARLVFITGGAYTPKTIDFLERVPNARLEKPILPAALRNAIAAVLVVVDAAV